MLFLSHVDALGNSFIWGVRILEGTFLPQTSQTIKKTKLWNTKKRLNECLFILTRTHSMQIFGEIPLIKLVWQQSFCFNEIFSQNFPEKLHLWPTTCYMIPTVTCPNPRVQKNPNLNLNCIGPAVYSWPQQVKWISVAFFYYSLYTSRSSTVVLCSSTDFSVRNQSSGAVWKSRWAFLDSRP